MTKAQRILVILAIIAVALLLLACVSTACMTNAELEACMDNAAACAAGNCLK